MRHILAGSSLLAALILLAAPAAAEASVSTSALLALVPDRATIALATERAPTASLYVITATAIGNGSISPSGEVPATPSTDRKFTMTPQPCALLDNVRVDGVDLGPLATYTFHNVSADHTIEASFVPSPPDTIVASALAGGTISPAGAVVYGCGDDATYTITADECHFIRDVRVDGASQGATPSFTFTNLKASHTIIATFILIPKLTITAASSANGTITPSGAFKADCGADQTFSFSPNACYQIADVVVDGTSQGPVTSYTFTNIRTAHTIAASFVHAATRDTITASAGPGGTIEPSGAIPVDCGTTKTFTVRHDACYRILDVVVDGTSRGAVDVFSFPAISASHTISASFASAPQYPITATAGPGGAIVPSGNVQVDCGGSQTFTFTPLEHFSVVAVVVDGVRQTSTSSYTFANVNDPHSISVQFASDYHIEVTAEPCETGYTPVVRGGRFAPNSAYWFDVQPLECLPPASGATLAKAGSVHTDAFGNIDGSDAPCYTPRRYTVILDVLGTGVFAPLLDPIKCFVPGNPTAATGIQDLDAGITSEGAVLSWWLMDIAVYRGFVIHRAPEDGEEEIVTPQP